MSKESAILLPKHKRLLERLGENLKLARKRRKLTTLQVSERAGIGRTTLYRLENGDPSCSLGHLLNVLVVLGLEKDIEQVARDDELGRKLQDAELLRSKN